MSYKIFINYYLNKLTFFKSLIYFYKKFFFSSENKNIINQKVKKIEKIFTKKNNYDNQILFNPVFNFNQVEYFEFLTYLFKIFELSNYKPTIFSSFKSYEIFKSANFNLKESLIFYSDLRALKNFKNLKKN